MGGGVQRVLKFCKYLSSYGWNPIVLTVKDGEFPSLDNSLMRDAKDIVCTKQKVILYIQFLKNFRVEKMSHHIKLALVMMII